jgi:hypothetical protein
MTILDTHTATSLNESIKRKLSWSVTQQTAQQLTHSTQHTHTTSSKYRHNRRHAEWGIHIFKPWFWTPFKWFQSGFIIIYTSVLYKHEYWGCGSVDATNIPNWMRHCYVSFYFCCYNRCQQAPSRGSPPPPYDSSTRPLLQSCYSLQLGSICSPIPPLPLILLPYIITVFLLLLLLLFLLFSTLS